jgi:hypothetical protein
MSALCAELTADLFETEELGTPARQAIDDVPPGSLAARMFEIGVDLVIERHDVARVFILATRTQPPGRFTARPPLRGYLAKSFHFLFF